MKYTCPMHPEIISDKLGNCPKCGMRLVEKTSDGQQPQQTPENQLGLGKLTWKSYLPLLVIIGLIFATSLALSFNDLRTDSFTLVKSISYFMIGFFLVFSGFKMLDLKGFAEGYHMYDLLAKRVFAYGYVYPFIELFFALAMIVNFTPTFILWSEVIVMGFSGLGVLLKMLKKEKFQCVCLGTSLKVPLTTVTLIEDFGMATLALLVLLIS